MRPLQYHDLRPPIPLKVEVTLASHRLTMVSDGHMVTIKQAREVLYQVQHIIWDHCL